MNKNFIPIPTKYLYFEMVLRHPPMSQKRFEC